jgi:ADP-heptose:LPS heptosyltransferase
MLFVRTDRLGETVLNIPAMAALKAAFPQASLTVLVHSDVAPLLRRLPIVDEVRCAPSLSGWREAWWFSQGLRKARYDLAVVSNPRKDLHLAAWLAGIPVRVGYRRKWGGLLSHRLEDRKALGDCHEVEYNLDLVRMLDVPVSIPQWPWPSFEPEQRELAGLLKPWGVEPEGRFVVVHPWTSNPRKQWPLERFRGLMESLQQRKGLTIAVVGAHPSLPLSFPEVEVGSWKLEIGSWKVEGVENRRASTFDLRPSTSGGGIVDLVGKLSLAQLAACLRRARVLVSNDSGPMHLAASLRTPVVALFGTEEQGSHPTRWGPWGIGHTVIHKPLANISVKEVVEAVERYVT